MGEMISMIAHQWRQPLNSLAVLTQTIALKYNRGKLNDEMMQNFEKNCTKQIQGMSETINDFSNFFKPESEKVVFEINSVISRTLDMVRPVLLKHEIALLIHKSHTLYSYGFPQELGQALINIINNAKDVLIEKNIVDKKIEVKTIIQQQNIVITISDNAGGIPTDILNKIFEPYFSTKSVKNGTGLGLYMSKMIIEDHMQGTLTCSNSDIGAVFKITLALKEDIA